MISYEIDVLKKILQCLWKNPLMAQIQEEEEEKEKRPRFRLGWGGDLPVSPALALVVALAGGGILSWGTGRRGRMIAPVLLLTHRWKLPRLAKASIRLVAGLVVAKSCSAVKQSSDVALTKAGTTADMDSPVPSVATTGPYQYCRNPLYLATFGIPLTMGLWADNAVLVLGANAVLAVYFHAMAIPAEEAFLTKTLGEEYTQYKATVKRWGIF